MVDRLVPVMEGWFRNHAEHPAARPYRYNAIGDCVIGAERAAAKRAAPIVPTLAGPARQAWPGLVRRGAAERLRDPVSMAQQRPGHRGHGAAWQELLDVVTLIAPTASPSRPKIPAAMQRMPSLSSSSSSRVVAVRRCGRDRRQAPRRCRAFWASASAGRRAPEDPSHRARHGREQDLADAGAMRPSRRPSAASKRIHPARRRAGSPPRPPSIMATREVMPSSRVSSWRSTGRAMSRSAPRWRRQCHRAAQERSAS